LIPEIVGLDLVPRTGQRKDGSHKPEDYRPAWLGALDFGALQSLQDCADHAACHPILQIEDAGV
jgi:hypothetical protein